MKNSLQSSNFVKHFTVSFILKILGLFISYVFFIFLTKRFGSGTVGIFSMSFSFLNLLFIVSSFSFDAILTKIFSENYYLKNNEIFYNLKKLYIKSLIFISVISIPLIISLYFLLPDLLKIFNKDYLYRYFCITLAVLIPYSIYMMNTSVLRGMGKVNQHMFLKHIALYLLTLILIFIFLKLKLFVFEDKSEFVLYMFSISVIVLFILSFYFFKDIFFVKQKDISSSVFKFPYSFKYVLRSSVNIFISSVTIAFIELFTIFTLGFIHSEVDVGVYSIMLKFALFISLPIILTNTIIPQEIGKYWRERDLSKLRESIIHASKISIITSFIILLILFLLSVPLLSHFGEEFLDNKTAFYVLILGQFFNVFLGNVGFVLIMIDEHNYHRNVFLISLIVNIFLTIILIQKYNVLGAAISYSLTIVLQKYLLLLKVKSKIGIYPFQWLLKFK